MFQGFEWFAPKDQKHWQRLRDAIPILKAIGVDNIWIPPGCKAGWHGSNGYDTYDLYDLGEFEQKGSRGTKWGTKAELVEMIHTANAHGVGILWDAVLNHKAAADYTERCLAVKVDSKGTCIDPKHIRGNRAR
jgi:alpha-amylase